MRPDAPHEADKPVPVLLRELGDEIGMLVRQELALARAEMVEKSRPAMASAGMFGAGALFGLGAFAAMTACIIAALALVVPLWAGALVVAVLYGIVAGVLAITGKKTLQEAAPIVPQQAAESVKEDVEWAKTRAKSGMR
jgi:hypothetical protein